MSYNLSESVSALIFYNADENKVYLSDNLGKDGGKTMISLCFDKTDKANVLFRCTFPNGSIANYCGYYSDGVLKQSGSDFSGETLDFVIDLINTAINSMNKLLISNSFTVNLSDFGIPVE